MADLTRDDIRKLLFLPGPPDDYEGEEVTLVPNRAGDIRAAQMIGRMADYTPGQRETTHTAPPVPLEGPVTFKSIMQEIFRFAPDAGSGWDAKVDREPDAGKFSRPLDSTPAATQQLIAKLSAASDEIDDMAPNKAQGRVPDQPQYDLWKQFAPVAGEEQPQAPAPAAEAPPFQDLAVNTMANLGGYLARTHGRISDVASAAGHVAMAPIKAADRIMKSPTGSNTVGEDAVNAAAVIPAAGFAKAAIAGVEPNALGVFGGKLAKSANHEKLAEAQRLTGRGATRDEVWEKTGWFQGADHKWRFEIPDDGIALRRGRKIEHPEVEKAYPEQANDLTALSELADKEQGMFIKEFNMLLAGGPDKKTKRNVAAHEYQHFVSDIEGFPPGSAPAKVKDFDIMKPMEREPAIITSLRKALDYPGNKGHEEVIKLNLRDHYKRELEHRAYLKYHADPGEAEARNAAKRLLLTPEERVKYPPWITGDPQLFPTVAREIVKARKGAAAQPATTSIHDLLSSLPADAKKFHAQDGRVFVRGADGKWKEARDL